VTFIVGYDFRFGDVVAGLGNMEAVATAFVSIGSIGIIRRLQCDPFRLFF
jgi:hypothetical protein